MRLKGFHLLLHAEIGGAQIVQLLVVIAEARCERLEARRDLAQRIFQHLQLARQHVQFLQLAGAFLLHDQQAFHILAAAFFQIRHAARALFHQLRRRVDLRLQALHQFARRFSSARRVGSSSSILPMRGTSILISLIWRCSVSHREIADALGFALGLFAVVVQPIDHRDDIGLEFFQHAIGVEQARQRGLRSL